MIPYRIYLSGGGIASAGHIGALQELSKHISLVSVKEWMGVSAGAFVSMCLCLGYTLDELADFCIRFDFSNIKEVDSIPGWLLHLGLDTGDRLHRLIEACLHVKGLSSDLTFKECHDLFGYSLRVIATDLNEAKPVIFSPDTSPGYRISDAVRASMNVPYYFQPFICPETGHYLLDGAVISNYPMFLLSKEEQARTISILIRVSIESKETIEIDDFLLRPLSILYVKKLDIESLFYNSHCIQVHLDCVDVMDFGLGEDAKNILVEKGRDAVKIYIKQQPKLKRRNSFS
jgi:predicted acylesterase/phospholipase RssA